MDMVGARTVRNCTKSFENKSSVQSGSPRRCRNLKQDAGHDKLEHPAREGLGSGKVVHAAWMTPKPAGFQRHRNGCPWARLANRSASTKNANATSIGNG